MILPKDTYKKMPRSRLLTESVRNSLFRNGEQWVFNNLEDGFTTSCIDHSHISYCLEEPKALIHKLGYHHPDLSPHLTPLFIEPDIHALLELYFYIQKFKKLDCFNQRQRKKNHYFLSFLSKNKLVI